MYEDLTLHTADDVSIRAYLLLQRQNVPDGSRILEPGASSDDEVRNVHPRRRMHAS